MAIMDRCADETDAYLLLEELRWHGEPVCAHCGHDKAYFLAPKNGVSRATGPKKTQSVRRVWKCARCRKQFSVLTGTIFHGTKIPLRTWLLVLAQVCSAKNGISAREVARMHEITPESAWHMVHRIREAMKLDPLAGILTGTVEADELFHGGKPQNRHASDPRPRGAQTKKSIVFTIVHPESGEARSRIIPNVNSGTLRKALEEHVDPSRTTLHTDNFMGYFTAGWGFQQHKSVNHAHGEYVRGNVTTNRVEGFFSQLARSIDGTHHAVSHKHLERYVTHFEFMYSTCKLNDSARMRRLLGQVTGRRLSYRSLAG